MARSLKRAEFLGDIIVTAVEAGYPWFLITQYQYVDTLIDRLIVVEGEQEGDETRATLHQLKDDETGYKAERLDLTLGAVARGLSLAIENGDETLRYANRENDAGMIDANDADSIVQLALLGEIVYG